MDKRAGIAAAAIVVLCVAVIGFGALLLSGAADEFYYTQVDNERVSDVESKGGVFDPTGGMSLSYALPAYDKNGSEKEISFGTERKLREGAYLCLKVVPIRGVVEWKEVRFDELPVKVQDAMRQ
jgi:uncharacterized protein (TIGR01655 family)